MVKNREDILQMIQQIMQDMFEIEPATVMLDTHLQHDLDFDSIDAVDMIVKLKELTGKPVKPEDFKNAKTVQDVVEAVYKLVNEAS